MWSWSKYTALKSSDYYFTGQQTCQKATVLLQDKLFLAIFVGGIDTGSIKFSTFQSFKLMYVHGLHSGTFYIVMITFI